MDAAVDDLEAEGFVGLLRDAVIDEGVGGHFAAAVGAGPVFGGGEEGASDALAPKGRLDIPAFEVANRVGVVATVGMGTEADFGKADDLPAGRLGYQEGEREAGGALSRELGDKFVRVLSDGAFRPEGVAKLGEAVEVRGCGGTDHQEQGTGYRVGDRARAGPIEFRLAWAMFSVKTPGPQPKRGQAKRGREE